MPHSDKPESLRHIFKRSPKRMDGTRIDRYDVRVRKGTEKVYVGTEPTIEDAIRIRDHYLTTGQKPERKKSGLEAGVYTRRADGSYTNDPQEMETLRKARKDRHQKRWRDHKRNNPQPYDSEKRKAQYRNSRDPEVRPAPQPRKPLTFSQQTVQRVALRAEVREELKDRLRQLMKRGHGESCDFVTARAEEVEMLRELITEPRVSVVVNGRFVRLKLEQLREIEGKS